MIDYRQIAWRTEPEHPLSPPLNWFRYKPSHSARLVNHVLDSIGVRDTHHVHDPFSGAATTLVEAARRGCQTSSIEVNPFLQLVGRVYCDCSLRRAVAHELLDPILSAAKAHHAASAAGSEMAPADARRAMENTGFWRADVLDQLLALTAALSSVRQKNYREFFILALASVLVPGLTNVVVKRLGLARYDREGEKNVFEVFSRQANRMIRDLDDIGAKAPRHSPVQVGGDATRAATYDGIWPIDVVIASPPYPNRFSYVSHTLPYLVLFGEELGIASTSLLGSATIGEPPDSCEPDCSGAREERPAPQDIVDLCQRIARHSIHDARYVAR